MAFTLDAKTDSSLVSSTGLTQSHTTAVGASLLTVSLEVREAFTATMTYGGVAMTEDITREHATDTLRASVFRLFNPPSGANNVVVSLSGSAAHRIQIASWNSGAASLDVTGSAEGTSTTPAASVSGAVGGLGVDAMISEANSASAPTVGADQTIIFAHGETSWQNGGSYDLAPSASEQFDWTCALSDTWVQVVAIYKESAATGGGTAATRIVPMALRRMRPFSRPILGFPAPGQPGGPLVVNQGMDATTVLVTASMQKQVNKGLTAMTVAATASMVKQVNKALTATTVAVTASMVALKVILKTMTATTVVVTASMVKQVNKILSATAVVVTASIVKQVNKLLTATTVVVTATMAAIKVILRTLTATTVAVTATFKLQVNKPLTATTLAVTGSIVKQVNKAMTATTVAVTATMLAIKVILKTMTATAVVVTATMARRVNFSLSATVAATASITKSITHRLTATVSAVASMVATFLGPIVGPFAARVDVADSISNMVTLTDPGGTSVDVSDASGTTVATSDSPSTTTGIADASGTTVDVRDVLP